MRINLRSYLGLLAINLVCTGVTFWLLQQAYNKGLRSHLEQTAKSIPYILKREYFNNITGINSVSDGQYTQIQGKLEKYIKDIPRVSAIYAYTLENDRVVEVAHTSVKGQSQSSYFFLEYQSADQKVKSMLKEANPLPGVVQYKDEYGEFIGYFIPYTNRAGKRFLLGANFLVTQQRIDLAKLLAISFVLSSSVLGAYAYLLRYRSRFPLATTTCQIVAILLGAVGFFREIDRLHQEYFRRQLYTAARTIIDVLGEDFFARAQNRYSISEREHRENAALLNEYARYTGIKYLYGLRQEGKIVVFIADSGTQPGLIVDYWEVYDTAPRSILPLFVVPGQMFLKYTDEYGTLVSVYFSSIDSTGKSFVLGADQDYKDILRVRINDILASLFVIGCYSIALLIWERILFQLQLEKTERTQLRQRLFWKMTGITSTAIVVFLTGFYFYAQWILYKSYGSIEEVDVKEQLEELTKAIGVEERFFGRRFNDWLVWNGIPQMVKVGKEDIRPYQETLRKLEVNLIAYFDAQKQLLWSETYDKGKKKSIPELATDLSAYFAEHPDLMNSSPGGSSLKTGIIYLNEELYFLALVPVDGGKTTPQGTFVCIKRLDDAFVVSLAQRQKLNVRLYSITYARQVERFQDALEKMLASGQNAIVPENDTYIYGYTLLQDIYKKPVAFVRLVAQREVWLKANQVIDRTFLVGLASCGLVILATNNFFVLRRLFRLVRNIEAIQQGNDRTQRLPLVGNDEISYLVQTFNQLLNTVETEKQTIKSINKQLEIANEKFSKAFRASPNAIAIVTLEEGQFYEVNPAFVRMVGYSEDEILGRTIVEIDNWLTKEERPKLAKKLEHQGSLQNYEIRFFNKQGEARVGSLSAEIIFVHDTPCILYNLADITELKIAEEKLRNERDKADRLLENVLPKSIAYKLKQNIALFSTATNDAYIAEQYDNVAVLFADLVGFSQLSRRTTPKDLVGLLNRVFSIFDQLTETYKLEKIKTIGDAYMAVAGLPLPMENPLQAVASMALEMQREIAQFRTYEGEGLSLRIGIDTGSVVAGTIGKKKFAYDLWGDPVNIASRMESQGEPGKIQVTEKVYQVLNQTYLLAERGIIFVKGIGEMRTYWLLADRGSYN